MNGSVGIKTVKTKLENRKAKVEENSKEERRVRLLRFQCGKLCSPGS